METRENHLTKQFEASPGNRSNSRITGFIAVLIALAMAQEVLIMGYLADKSNIVVIASAAVTTFVGIGGPAMGWMSYQKYQERKSNNQSVSDRPA